MRVPAVAMCVLLVACSSKDRDDEPEKEAPSTPGAEQASTDRWPSSGTFVATRTYGVGKVTSTTDKSVSVEASLGQKLQIPRDKVEDMLRPLADEATADRMLAALRAKDVEADGRPWGQRHKEYLATIRKGDPLPQARILRTLYATTEPLSFAEAKLAAQIELLIFDEIARAKGTTVEALEKEFYGRHPKAAPRSKRDPMKGDCWMRFCYRDISVDGARTGKAVWLELMRNGNRFDDCVDDDQSFDFALDATVAKTGEMKITKLTSKAPARVSACVRKQLARVKIRGPASGLTDVHLAFSIRAVDRP